MPMPGPERRAARDAADCRRRLSGGSRSFHLASLLLPRRLRDDAAALYAFCRVADDAIDEGDDPAAALRELRWRLADAYRGRPADDPVDRALSRVVLGRAIPRSLLLALLEGFAWDAAGRRYASLSELTAYAVRVAGAVGVMMALLMGRRDRASLARAADLGVAMQFTNIARDVGEDALAGRLYLPTDWLAQAGVDPDTWLARPCHSPVLGRLVRRLLAEAEPLYRRADAGIAGLPASCRPAIRAARQLYAGIGDALAGQDFDAVSRRAVLAPAGKARRLLSLLHPPSVLMQSNAPVLPEAHYLLLAATRAVPRAVAVPAAAKESSTVGWVLDLFAELERRERAGNAPAPAILSQR